MIAARCAPCRAARAGCLKHAQRPPLPLDQPAGHTAAPAIGAPKAAMADGDPCSGEGEVEWRAAPAAGIVRPAQIRDLGRRGADAAEPRYVCGSAFAMQGRPQGPRLPSCERDAGIRGEARAVRLGVESRAVKNVDDGSEKGLRAVTASASADRCGVRWRPVSADPVRTPPGAFSATAACPWRCGSTAGAGTLCWCRS